MSGGRCHHQVESSPSQINNRFIQIQFIQICSPPRIIQMSSQMNNLGKAGNARHFVCPVTKRSGNQSPKKYQTIFFITLIITVYFVFHTCIYIYFFIFLFFFIFGQIRGQLSTRLIVVVAVIPAETFKFPTNCLLLSFSWRWFFLIRLILLLALVSGRIRQKNRMANNWR